MRYNRHRKKQTLGYSCMNDMNLTTDTSMSLLSQRTLIFMYFALHLQRTSRVRFIGKEELNENEVLGYKTIDRYLG